MKFDLKLISENLDKNEYKFIGAGSGREVYDLGNGYVVKVARNKRGLAQNKAEYDISLTDDTNLFAKIKQISQNSILLIMERAEKINHISEVWDYFHVNSNRELFQLEKFREISEKYDLLLADLRRHNNWGKVREKLVIIDYGFTWGVRINYYSLFKQR